MNLQGKNILVTGGSQGLGEVLCRMLAAQKANVYLNCAHHGEKAQRIAEEIHATVKQFDISDLRAVTGNFAEMEQECGGIDILINNARMDPYKRPETIDDAEWFDRITAVNVKGPYLCSIEAMKQMRKRGGGRIVNISSVWAYRAAPRKLLEYAMTKAALHSLTRSFAMLGAPDGITVNTIAPGYILSEEAAVRLTGEELRNMTAKIPVGRGAAPEEIFRAVLYAIQNPYVTGEILNINGGTYLP